MGFSKNILVCTALASAVFFSGCSSHEDALNAMKVEQNSVNECVNKNKNYEADCYGLLSSRNSLAQLRLGIMAEQKGEYKKALKWYETSKEGKNFYANTLLAHLYKNGLGVKKDERKAESLLKETDDIDPMAAYELSKFKMDKEYYDSAIDLLRFAANGYVKRAQAVLAQIYKEGKITDRDMRESLFWDHIYKTNKRSFKAEIYGAK